VIRRRAVVNRSIIGPVPLLCPDPPWRVDFYSDKGLERTPDQRYPTTLDEPEPHAVAMRWLDH
jgi:hypothetical protein